MPSIISNLHEPFIDSFYTIGESVGNIPIIIFAVIIVTLGWFIGSILRKLIEQAFGAFRVFDDALSTTGVEDVISRAGFKLNVGKFFGILVEIFVILVFLVAALDLVNLDQVNEYLITQVLSYIPNVIIASIIIVIGALVARIVKSFVEGATKATRMQSAGLVGLIANTSIWVFTILIALSQLGVAPGIIQSTINALIAALALAFGLAFGLGGQRAAADYLDRISEEIRR